MIQASSTAGKRRRPEKNQPRNDTDQHGPAPPSLPSFTSVRVAPCVPFVWFGCFVVVSMSPTPRLLLPVRVRPCLIRGPALLLWRCIGCVVRPSKGRVRGEDRIAGPGMNPVLSVPKPDPQTPIPKSLAGQH